VLSASSFVLNMAFSIWHLVTEENRCWFVLAALTFNRPYGTRIRLVAFPALETPGYWQLSLRDNFRTG
jgi:hypothetical protein